ncbi:sulfite exporter TauE/SafE family protein [Pseudonocardia nigra]|uniref:sulfite exporter TauE/SafE family protein n=1 Tax=Pseudonocardia nigra TaxID=1921578 RepID=UPI001C602E67|nr:sulfite exporter TauE/SafE family protein [Pseudonocardia nigra]
MSTGLLLLTAVVVVVAAFVQGSTGLGFALIVAPVVGLIEPRLLPVLLLVLMIPLNGYVAWRERHAMDTGGASWITAGRVAGTAGGLWVLFAVPASGLNLLIGGSTVLAALASLLAPSFVPGRRSLIAAGAVTGVTETATGIGGPPLALVYQHRPAPELRSTIAICFLVGEVISLGLLAATGQVDGEQLRTALMLVPALGLGALLSRAVHHRVDGPVMRTLVLGFALVSGVVVLVQG